MNVIAVMTLVLAVASTDMQGYWWQLLALAITSNTAVTYTVIQALGPRNSPRWLSNRLKTAKLVTPQTMARDEWYCEGVHCVETRNRTASSQPCDDQLNHRDISSNYLKDNSTLILSKLHNLKKLKLDKNFFLRIPIISNDSGIINLSLAHNKISSISATVLENYPNLKFLDVSFNLLTELNTKSFPVGCNLLYLNLNSNEINNINSTSLNNLQELFELKLNRNLVSSFSKDLFKDLKNLKILEVNRNNFTQIVGLTFYGLDNVEILKLRRNLITYLLDGAFFGLKNITALHLDHNNITSVRKGWLYGLISLKNLTLSNNYVSVIESDGWDFCKYLEELDLSNNVLEYISVRTFLHLSNLQKLNLNNNKITYIEEGAFQNTPNLEVLQLNSNMISWTVEDTSGTFTSLKHLVWFTLASNDIKSVNKYAFVGLEKLSHLDLRNNNITSLQENPFVSMRHLEELNINSTAFVCDCNLKWFHSWLQNLQLESIIAVCAYPPVIFGESVQNVAPNSFTCDDMPKPHILEHPKSHVALKGSNTIFTCKAVSSSNDKMTFRWKKDNLDFRNGYIKQYARSTKGKTIENKSELHLINVTKYDSGKYQCIVSNKFGATYTQKAVLSVLIYPIFTKIPDNITVTSGGTARLECASIGQPPPQIAWQKDGGTDFPAARERRMHVMPSDDVFFIMNIKTVDSGIYSCIAKNVVGVAVANASLTVLESPVFVKAMENKEITAGETIVLECMASGSPKPKLTWTKDGSPLHLTKRHFFTADDQLLIIVASELSDAGTYECLMTNKLGEKKGRSHLSVIPASTVVGDSDVTGLIIITVVCCAVGTSIIWVIIIYQTRKQIHVTESKSVDHNYPNPLVQHGSDFKDSSAQIYLDTNSEHSASKDSGTGDSSKHSSNNLLENESTSVLADEQHTYEFGKHILTRKKTTNKECISSSPALRNSRHTNHDRCQLNKHNKYQHRWSAPQSVASAVPISCDHSYASLPRSICHEVSSHEHIEGSDSSDETTSCILESQ